MVEGSKAAASLGIGNDRTVIAHSPALVSTLQQIEVGRRQSGEKAIARKGGGR